MENLGLDVKLLIAQVINFALFYFIFKRYFSKAFKNYLEKEKNKDVAREKLLKQAQKKDEEMIRGEQEFKQKIKRQTEAALAQAGKEAEQLKQQILEEAANEAEEIKKRAKKQIEQERSTLFQEAKEKITKLSFFIVNEALKDVLTEDVRKKITQAILKSSYKKNLTLNEN